MLFKKAYMKDQLGACSIVLQRVVIDFQELSLKFGKEPLITRVSDPVESESGVHLDLRAVDIRDVSKDLMGTKKPVYTDEERLALLNYINALWPRSDGKKTCVYHDAGDGLLHFHLQIPAEVQILIRK